ADGRLQSHRDAGQPPRAPLRRVEVRRDEPRLPRTGGLPGRAVDGEEDAEVRDSGGAVKQLGGRGVSGSRRSSRHPNGLQLSSPHPPSAPSPLSEGRRLSRALAPRKRGEGGRRPGEGPSFYANSRLLSRHPETARPRDPET